MEDIIEIVESFEDSGQLPEGVSETVQNEAKEQRGRFLSMLLGTLGASLSGNILAGNGINTAGEGAIAKSVREERQRRDKVEETRSKDCKSWLWKQKSSKATSKNKNNF